MVSLLPLLPEIARAAGIETIPAVAATLTITAAIQRVIAIPSVDSWLRLHTRWLSAEPYEGKHRKDEYTTKNNDSGPSADDGSGDRADD